MKVNALKVCLRRIPHILQNNMSDSSDSDLDEHLSDSSDEDSVDVDPWVTAVIYRARLDSDNPKPPLWRRPYYGQAVRQGTDEEIFNERKHEHEYDAANQDKDKELGFHAMLNQYDSRDIDWKILQSKSGPRSKMQAWANAEEKRLIAENGGPLRDMNRRLRQTLNQTEGGKGDSWWESRDALRRLKFCKFKERMDEYVYAYESSLVPHAYKDVDGFPLGVHLASFRKGRLWKGMPEQNELKEWAEALPKWAWKANKTEEYRAALSQRLKDRLANETPEVREQRVSKSKATWAAKTDEQKAISKRKIKATWAAKTDAENAERKRKQKATVDAKTDEEKADMQSKWKATMDAKTDEEKAEIKRKHLDAHRRPEVRAKISQMAKDHCAKRSAAELIRARKIAVPFVKSSKIRAQMRAESTDFSGRNETQLLYMVAEDGKTIRRVNNRGGMPTRDIVGPVVDPEPIVASDSD